MCATNYNSLCFTVIPRVYVKKIAIIFRIDQKPPLKKFDKRFASQLWQHLTRWFKKTRWFTKAGRIPPFLDKLLMNTMQDLQFVNAIIA